MTEMIRATAGTYPTPSSTLTLRRNFETQPVQSQRLTPRRSKWPKTSLDQEHPISIIVNVRQCVTRYWMLAARCLMLDARFKPTSSDQHPTPLFDNLAAEKALSYQPSASSFYAD
jgi:hypothetical protein